MKHIQCKDSTLCPITKGVVVGYAELLRTNIDRNFTSDLYRCEVNGTINYIQIKHPLSDISSKNNVKRILDMQKGKNSFSRISKYKAVVWESFSIPDRGDSG